MLKFPSSYCHLFQSISAASQPRKLFKNTQPCTFGTSSTRTTASVTRASRNATARPTPGSKPLESGGVTQRPSQNIATLPRVHSVISPSAFHSTVSKTPGVWE